MVIESFPATQGRMAESKSGKCLVAVLGKKSYIKWTIQGSYQQPEFLILQSYRERVLTHSHTGENSPAAFSSIHTSVRGQQFTSLKAQFSSPPNISSACHNCTGGTAALPRVHGKFQWCWQHLPTQIGVHLNILSDLKMCVGVAHCLFLNGLLIWVHFLYLWLSRGRRGWWALDHWVALAIQIKTKVGTSFVWSGSSSSYHDTMTINLFTASRYSLNILGMSFA